MIEGGEREAKTSFLCLFVCFRALRYVVQLKWRCVPGRWFYLAFVT